MSTKLDKYAYIEAITGWLMPDAREPELAQEARGKLSLDGVYTGRSTKIMRLVCLAYLRGVRKGAACAWNAQQPVTLRDSSLVPEKPNDSD